MTHLIWSGPARREVLAIAAHHRAIDPDLATHMLRQIQTAPLILLDHPRLGAPAGPESLRKWQVKGTPFLLFYTASVDRIEVKRVRHAAQDRPA